MPYTAYPDGRVFHPDIKQAREYAMIYLMGYNPKGIKTLTIYNTYTGKSEVGKVKLRERTNGSRYCVWYTYNNYYGAYEKPLNPDGSVKRRG